MNEWPYNEKKCPVNLIKHVTKYITNMILEKIKCACFRFCAPDSDNYWSSIRTGQKSLRYNLRTNWHITYHKEFEVASPPISDPTSTPLPGTPFWASPLGWASN